jgi:hypothetical protein
MKIKISTIIDVPLKDFNDILMHYGVMLTKE